MNVDAFDYALPEGRIAQRPEQERDSSRLLVIDRSAAGPLVHATFRQLGQWLRAKDLLVLNDTRVLPARLVGTKATGGRIEILLVEPLPAGTAPDLPEDGEEIWLCLAGFSRPPEEGSRIEAGASLEITWLGAAREGLHRLRLRPRGALSVREALDRVGRTPLPPYIQRNGGPEAPEDRERYQTVFAERDGAVAAPTAGLHFTRAMLDDLASAGVASARVTLHVGPATFQPVRGELVEDHRMGYERYEVPGETARAIERARSAGGRVVAVGTTVVRALESAADGRGGVLPARGRTDLFIYPGYRFRAVDALVTNFHLPRSTLLMLVAAFAGRERVLDAYAAAVSAGYRFYSYGDAMLIL